MVLYEVALYEKKQGLYSNALDKFKEIMQLRPTMRLLLSADMGICYYNLGDYHQALIYLNDAKQSGEFIPEALINTCEAKTK